jgi:predicted transcriptional regulator
VHHLGVNALGELETAVLEHVWDRGRVDVKAAHQAIGVPRDITLNTVQSTLERLFRKGLLSREKESHAYFYSARVTREELGGRLLDDLLAGVLQGRTEPMLAAFVDVADRAGEDELRRLEALVSKRLAARTVRR